MYGKSERTLRRLVASLRQELGKKKLAKRLQEGKRNGRSCLLIHQKALQEAWGEPPPPEEQPANLAPAVPPAAVQAPEAAAALLHRLQAENSFLKAQLEEKDRQLRARDAQLNELSTALRLLSEGNSSEEQL